jgi:DNA-binding transcriptional ArsR family regulator
MSKGLGRRQAQLLELLDTHSEIYQGEAIVRVAKAIDITGIHQSAMSRGLKTLVDRELIKVIKLGRYSQESLTLPTTVKGKEETLKKTKQVGSTVLAYTKADSALKDSNWQLVNEMTKDKAKHAAVMHALNRLKNVHFIIEKLVESKYTFKFRDDVHDRYSFSFYSNQSMSEPDGKVIGSGIPIKYITLESKVPHRELQTILFELAKVGHVKLAYSKNDMLTSKHVIGVI